MTKVDRNLDEYGKRLLAPLRPAPSMDSDTAAEAKKKYLLQVENLQRKSTLELSASDKRLRQQNRNLFWVLQHRPLVKTLFAVLVVIVLILAGSGVTVYAAQGSLPGQPLYTIKSWSEDFRFKMTFSTSDKLDLTLDYTNRRVHEISSLVADGKPLTSQTSDRYQRELDTALQLAAELDDAQIGRALGQIKDHATNQGMTVEDLINSLPPQAGPAILHLQERLMEQVQLSTYGEADPQGFRMEVNERLHGQQGPKHTPGKDENESAPTEISNSPMPTQEDKGQGNGNNKTIEPPGHNGQGNGQEQSTPGGGNHGPNPTHTPEP